MSQCFLLDVWAFSRCFANMLPSALKQIEVIPMSAVSSVKHNPVPIQGVSTGGYRVLTDNNVIVILKNYTRHHPGHILKLIIFLFSLN